MKEIVKSMILALLTVGVLYFVSWILTCGIIKLITMCFGMQFSWLIATGIWIILCIARDVFSH